MTLEEVVRITALVLGCVFAGIGISEAQRGEPSGENWWRATGWIFAAVSLLMLHAVLAQEHERIERVRTTALDVVLVEPVAPLSPGPFSPASDCA